MRLCTTKPAPVLRLHTKLPELYRSKVERLTEALNAPDTVTEAAEILRGLIGHIVLTPVDNVPRAELHGDLAVLARFAQAKESRAEIFSRGFSPAIISGCGGAQPA
jgi:site-specific DNA recombinase